MYGFPGLALGLFAGLNCLRSWVKPDAAGARVAIAVTVSVAALITAMRPSLLVSNASRWSVAVPGMARPKKSVTKIRSSLSSASRSLLTATA